MLYDTAQGQYKATKQNNKVPQNKTLCTTNQNNEQNKHYNFF